jgi:hypothetical protein
LTAHSAYWQLMAHGANRQLTARSRHAREADHGDC